MGTAEGVMNQRATRLTFRLAHLLADQRRGLCMAEHASLPLAKKDLPKGVSPPGVVR